MAKKMHPTQLAYAKAKALFETIEKQRDTEYKQLHAVGKWNPGEIMGDKRLEQICEAETAIDSKLGYWDAFHALRTAEKAMIDWSMGAVKVHPLYSKHQADIERLHKNSVKHPNIHAQLIALAFRLSV